MWRIMICVFMMIFGLVFQGLAEEASGQKNLEIVLEHYDNGIVKRELTYENKNVIFSREFFRDGTLALESFYANGLKNGLVKMYFESGDVAQEGLFKDDNVNQRLKMYQKTA